MKETNTHVSLYLNNSLNHSKLNELLPRHQQSSVKCLTIPVPVKCYLEMTLDNISWAMEAYLTRQLKFYKELGRFSEVLPLTRREPSCDLKGQGLISIVFLP